MAPGPRAATISITLGMSTCAGLTERQRFGPGPSGSSLACMSGFTGTGFQLHTGSMVISSQSGLGGDTGPSPPVPPRLLAELPPQGTCPVPVAWTGPPQDGSARAPARPPPTSRRGRRGLASECGGECRACTGPPPGPPAALSCCGKARGRGSEAWPDRTLGTGLSLFSSATLHEATSVRRPCAEVLCDAWTLGWDAAPTPGGYLTVSEKCPALGTDKDRQTHLHTGHLQVPRSQLSCR